MRRAAIGLAAVLAAMPVAARTLTFEDRVRAQEAIERVYYSHQIGATKPFEQAVTRELIERKVHEAEAAVADAERQLGRAFTSEELDREKERIERATTYPDRLRELLKALREDNAVREAIVAPTLARRVLQGADPMADSARGPGTEGSSCGEQWFPMATLGAPAPRQDHQAIWTGSLFVVWGGFTEFAQTATGGRYDPLLDLWAPMSTTNAPSGREDFSAVWTGTHLVVWGGLTAGGQTATGGRYDPVSDTWLSVATTGAPSARSEHVAVWTGSRMIVWGGSATTGATLCEDRFPITGGIYDPVSDTWSATPTSGAPTGRSRFPTIWTGTEMVVWGGYRQGTWTADPLLCNDAYVASGARLDPTTGVWTALPASSGLTARSNHVAVWTGSDLVVWGGRSTTGPYFPSPGTTLYADGARWNAGSNAWSPIASTGAPSARSWATAAWTGGWMLVWGGPLQEPTPGTGGRWTAGTDRWSATTLEAAPSARGFHAAAWAGDRWIVWGGQNSLDGRRGDGGVYLPGAFDPNESDGDGWPDSCDPCPAAASNDADGDGFCGDVDTCPLVADPTQADGDADGVGDACDNCASTPNGSQVDGDADGVGDACDNCASTPNGSQADGDHDGRGDACDNCATVANASQANADGDAWGDACDNCPLAASDSQADSDADGRGNICDNCAGVANPAQADSDADGRGDRCDNCPEAANPSQADGDSDGAGDPCDCQPLDRTDRRPPGVSMLGVSRTGSSITLSWVSEGTADGYSVTRGDLATKGPGLYGSCQANGITTTEWTDAQAPSPGQGWSYLVQAQNFDCGMGSLGTTSSEEERVNTSPGACGGVVVTDTRATGESTVFGTVSGTFTATQSSNDAYESITEAPSSGGNPGSRYSQLEHHWTVSVASGSVRQLHVEGFRSSSSDGDDFRFEWSTNGTTWTPVTLASLPLSDDGIDLIGTLASGAVGTVTIRVVDTNRAPGTLLFDTVTIDELFVRTTP